MKLISNTLMLLIVIAIIAIIYNPPLDLQVKLVYIVSITMSIAITICLKSLTI